MAHPPHQGGYGYSTLEVDDARLPETVAHNPDLNYPEVVVQNNSYPEVVHPPGYQEVKPYDAYRPYPGEEEGGAAVVGGGAGARVCGLKRKTFWMVVGAAAVIIIAVVVGVVAGVLAPRNGSSSSSDSDADGATGSDSNSTGSDTAILSTTRLASANFTDAQDNANYLVVYQLQNKAIYISAYNSSTDKWVVSPIIDGSTSISLDDVQEGTGLGLDAYYHSNAEHDVHLYWQAPDSTLRTVLYRTNLSTTTTLDPSRWEDPYSIQDRYSGLSGSALGSYGHQCDACTPWTYFFWQGAEGAIHGAWRTTDSEDGWGDITFTQNVAKPVTNSSIAITNVPALDGTQSIDLFYQASSGVLTQIIFDGAEGYRAVTLPRGDLGDRASIVAFATGWNETDTDNEDLEPVGFQVLTVDRDDDSSGVGLTYFKDGSWTAGDDITELADCTTYASMAANLGRRVYCVVDGGDGNTPQIMEWSWAAEPTGNLADYTNYNRVGAVGTPE